ncbi:hypothetical protein CY34DRAFT_551512 [Suillus luteus UH-Slu-Lm8-n1]|uniref:Uncharacterized protein n=1 Tax=Suillus luteus UH-Slu-Lm8-n1 TaxID=930992 RepID=A0A0C9ZEQ3_9AGAM|nr:hypothetical protein CY34DRAFT_551512 [Suillus luteus UH-Slu-Lm8-n1]
MPEITSVIRSCKASAIPPSVRSKYLSNAILRCFVALFQTWMLTFPTLLWTRRLQQGRRPQCLAFKSMPHLFSLTKHQTVTVGSKAKLGNIDTGLR